MEEFIVLSRAEVNQALTLQEKRELQLIEIKVSGWRDRNGLKPLRCAASECPLAKREKAK